MWIVELLELQVQQNCDEIFRSFISKEPTWLLKGTCMPLKHRDMANQTQHLLQPDNFSYIQIHHPNQAGA